MAEEHDIQHCIQIQLDDNSLSHLSAFVETGSPIDLGVPSDEAIKLFYEFLLDTGRFKWSDAAYVANMLGGLQRPEFLRGYVRYAVDRSRKLDDLALIGGDDSFCAMTARQILNLDANSLELLAKNLRRFVDLWERNLRLTIDIWPEDYRNLSSAVDRAFYNSSQRVQSAEAQFTEIVTEYGPLITRIASSYEGDPALREDLIQQIFLAVWQALPSYRADNPLKTFIARIAQNRSISFVTKQGRQQIQTPLSYATNLIAADGPTPEESAIYMDERIQLLEAIRSLPRTQRDVMVLVLEGLSYAEIARILEIAPNALALRLGRAKSALKEVLSPLLPGAGSM